MQVKDNNDPEIFIEIYNAIKSIKTNLNTKLGKHYEVEICDIKLENEEIAINPNKRWIDKFYIVEFLIINRQINLRMTFDIKIDVNRILYSYYKDIIIKDMIGRVVENGL